MPLNLKYAKLCIYSLCSILNNVPSFKYFVYMYTPDIILVAETWCKESVCDSSMELFD